MSLEIYKNIFIRGIPILEVSPRCIGLPSFYKDKVKDRPWQSNYCWANRLSTYDYESHSCLECKRPRWFREEEK